MQRQGSALMKRMEATQAKKVAESRMTNVVCSTAIFPEGFEVDDTASGPTPKRATGSPHFTSQPATEYGSMSSPPTRREPSGADSDADSCSEGAQTLIIPLSHIENQLIAQQVQLNTELLKHKLFVLFEMCVLPSEEVASLRRVEEVEQALLQTTQALAVGGSTPSSSDLAPIPSGRPSSATRGRATSASAVAQQTALAVDTYFRFAFEEVALRWHAMQQRPFSLRLFHQVARDQINLREAAQHQRGVSEQTVKSLSKEVAELQLQLSGRDTQHAERLQTLLTENRVLRQRVADLQQRQKIDEPIPTLFAHQGGSQLAGSSGGVLSDSLDGVGGSGGAVDPNEKQYETLNRRLTEECALLSHSLEQSNQVVRSLHTELQSTKMQLSTVKDDYKRYVQDQEQADNDMRRIFAQNEQITEQCRKESQKAVKRAAEAEQQMETLAQSVGSLKDSIVQLTSEKGDVTAERDHLRKVNELLIQETESAKEALIEVKTTSEEAVRCAQEAQRVAEARVAELENDGTRAKLEATLRDLSAAEDRIKSLQRSVESRDKVIHNLKQEHKDTVNKLEEKIAKQAEELASTVAKFEELLVREKQKGVELAEKRVADAKAEFAVERSEWEGKVTAAERVQEDLVHEVMLFHRQSSLLEPFLRASLTKEQKRGLAKLNLRRDLRNVVTNAGGESDTEDSAMTMVSLNGPSSSAIRVQHTPRTRLYFGTQHVFQPEDVQSRLTMASEALDKAYRGQVPQVDAEAPTIPPLETTAALLLKSKITEEFLLQIRERHQFRMPPIGSFIPKEERSAAEPSTGTGGEAADPLETDGDDIPEDPAAAIPMRLLDTQRSMMVHDMKSRLLGAKVRIKALEDEIFSMKQGDHLISSAASPSSLAFASSSRPESASSRKPSAGRSRPSSAGTGSATEVEQAADTDVHDSQWTRAPSSGPFGIRRVRSQTIHDGTSLTASPKETFVSPTPVTRAPSITSSSAQPLVLLHDTDADDLLPASIVSRHQSMASLRRGSSVAILAPSSHITSGSHARFDSRHSLVAGLDETTCVMGEPLLRRESVASSPAVPLAAFAASLDETNSGYLADETDPIARLTMEFPGIHHAAEYLDLLESFVALRSQLKDLVALCSQEAERGALHPDDLQGAQDLLHAKFTVFRSVEAQNSLMLQRLRKKKENMMRMREEELEKVLDAMQNISVTHPRETSQLLRVAKSATQRRLIGLPVGSAAAANHPQTALSNATRPNSSGGDSNQLKAVVIRPLSQQSLRRPSPTPTDVVVSGAPALLSLRNARVASATGVRGSR